MLNIFGKSPAIDDIPLHDRSDISVGEICSSNKNVAIIGNNQCSFRIFCQNGKIRCDNRKCDVELLPGTLMDILMDFCITGMRVRIHMLVGIYISVR